MLAVVFSSVWALLVTIRPLGMCLECLGLDPARQNAFIHQKFVFKTRQQSLSAFVDFEILQGVMKQGAAAVRCQMRSCRRQAAKLQCPAKVTNSFHCDLLFATCSIRSDRRMRPTAWLLYYYKNNFFYRTLWPAVLRVQHVKVGDLMNSYSNQLGGSISP